MPNTVSMFHGACRLPASRLARRHHEIFAHRQALEDAAALRHQRHAARRDLLRRQPRHRGAEHLDRAMARRQQTHRDIHAGRFAGAVAPQQAEQPAFAERERHLVQHMAVAVIGVDVAERQRAQWPR